MWAPNPITQTIRLLKVKWGVEQRIDFQFPVNYKIIKYAIAMYHKYSILKLFNTLKRIFTIINSEIEGLKKNHNLFTQTLYKLKQVQWTA